MLAQVEPTPSSPPPKIKYIMCLRIASRRKHAAENVTSEWEATRFPCSSTAGAISRAQSSGQTAPTDVFRDEQTVPCTVTAPCLAWVGSGNGSWENSSALPRLSFGCMENPCRNRVKCSGWRVGGGGRCVARGAIVRILCSVTEGETGYELYVWLVDTVDIFWFVGVICLS